MRKVLLLGLVLLICLTSASARHLVTTTGNTTYWNYIDVPDTEVYILDEEANKDKLYCKTKTGAEGKVVQTDWYNYCTLEFVKSEEGDKCTEELRRPEFECVFAKGSNADKLYCRTVKDKEGNVVETRWFNFCSNELIKTEDKDTCTNEFKSPAYKCYKNEIETEEKPKEQTQIANPASVYCIEQGGNLDMRETPEGTAGYCLLQDGTECEEWAYYRGECPKEEVPAEEPTEVIPEKTPSEPEVTPVKVSWFSRIINFFRNLFK